MHPMSMKSCEFQVDSSFTWQASFELVYVINQNKSTAMAKQIHSFSDIFHTIFWIYVQKIIISKVDISILIFGMKILNNIV